MGQLDDQLNDAQRNRDDFDLAIEIERQTVEAAVQICREVVFEIGAMPGSSIHSALKEAADRIHKLAK